MDVDLHKNRTLFSALRGLKHWVVVNIFRNESRYFFIEPLKLMFKVPSKSIFSWHLAKYQSYEQANLNLLLRYFEYDQGGVFVDVGANFGWYSLLFSRFAGKKGMVIALEPASKNYQLLLHNQDINEITNILTLQMAAGNQELDLMLGMAPDSNPGMHSLADLPWLDKETKGEMVNVRRLDDLLEPYLCDIELMKVDVEGFEVAVLGGASTTLRRCKFLLIEYSPRYIKAAGNSTEQFFDILKLAGFSFYNINYDGTCSNLGELAINRLINESNDYFQDLFCVNRNLIKQDLD